MTDEIWDEDLLDDLHDDSCFDEETGEEICNPCWHCGEHSCAGYCDDYQTYNLRPAETGGGPR